MEYEIGKGIPLGEAIIYAKFPDETYVMFRVSKSPETFEDPGSPDPDKIVRLSRGRDKPFLWYQPRGKLSEKDLEIIIRNFRPEDIDISFAGEITPEKVLMLNRCLIGYYDDFVRTFKDNKIIRPISDREEKELAGNLDRFLRDPFAERALFE